MSDNANKSEKGKTRKAKANRRSYLAEKAKQDRILLRLNKGDASKLDAVCEAAGVSRSAFARLHLVPCLVAHANALDQPGAAYAAPTLNGATALIGTKAPAVGDEFDHIFQADGS